VEKLHERRIKKTDTQDKKLKGKSSLETVHEKKSEPVYGSFGRTHLSNNRLELLQAAPVQDVDGKLMHNRIFLLGKAYYNE
jgi:hypothetical protein